MTRIPLLTCLVALLAAGCTSRHDTAAPAPPPATSAPLPATSAPAAAPTTTGTPSAGPTASDWRVTYGWAVPSRPARVTHPVAVPVTPPPGSPLPLLVEVRVGEHPAEGYTRVTFAFRGPTPSYEVAYVRAVPAEGTGEPIRLAGNAFLAIRFDPAQAHDEQGRPTVTASPGPRTGSPVLADHRLAGDFEGHVGYGLGLRVAPGGDQVPPVRLGESTRPDGSHVVAVDIRYG